MVPVGPGRVLVEAVREGLAGERAEVAVQHRVVLGQGADDGQVRDRLAGAVGVEVRVVADREGVGLGQRHARVVRRGGRPLQEAVHLAEVVLDQEAFPAVVGVAVAAALEVGRQRVVAVVVAVRRQVGQVVPAVGAGQPAEEVVERPVLHHQHDDVLDAVRAVRRQRRGGPGRGLGEEFRAGDRHAGGGGHQLQKCPACQHESQYGQPRDMAARPTAVPDDDAQVKRGLIPGPPFSGQELADRG